jgi:hypothetical protein
LADRDPLGRVALGEAVGGLADQGGPVGGEQQHAARLGPAGLDGRLQTSLSFGLQLSNSRKRTA